MKLKSVSDLCRYKGNLNEIEASVYFDFCSPFLPVT
jgi:hypothetical protein